MRPGAMGSPDHMANADHVGFGDPESCTNPMADSEPHGQLKLCGSLRHHGLGVHLAGRPDIAGKDDRHFVFVLGGAPACHGRLGWPLLRHPAYQDASKGVVGWPLLWHTKMQASTPSLTPPAQQPTRQSKSRRIYMCSASELDQKREPCCVRRCARGTRLPHVRNELN